MTTHISLIAHAGTSAATVNPLRWSRRSGALISGWAQAVMTPAAIFGYFIAIKGTWIVGDAGATADAIAAAPALWIGGASALFVVALLDIVAAMGTTALFATTDRKLAIVAGLTRALFALAFIVAIAQLFVAFAQVDEPARALASIESFWAIWQVALGVFGSHLLLVAYLAYRSGFVPVIFAGLLAVSGASYLADLAGFILIDGFAPTFATFGFVGEVAMIFWLLIAGRKRSGAEGAPVDRTQVSS